ncbi:MFS transporter [Jiangella ureilytica]|uniref:MFS transporter n=1 Tax=Jiangella ureilytica TaxID=2530374 RepID=A0A4R4RU00_9ACTN|nr:MFS transporter [Jiangella ureilytica]TDC53134.1 MFS transporter [Jiangella ureilytica]
MYITLRDRPKAGEQAPPRSKQKVSSVVVTLGVVSLMTDISSEAVAAILPLYVTAALGLTTIAYGFIDGLMQGASALVRIAGGWAADRGDHPKWVAVAGYGLSMLTRAGLLVASGFAAITALVAVDRVGKGIRTAPRDAMITAASDPAHLGRSFGVHRTLDTIGAALGPLLAFIVLWAIPDGYTTVFVLSLGCAVIGFALLALLVPDTRPRRQAASKTAGAKPAGRPFSWRSVAEPRLRRLLVVSGVLGLLTIGDGFIYLALQSRDGFATQWFPLLYVGTNLAYLALAIPVGRLADRVGRARVLVLGHLALLAAYLCAGAATGVAGLTIAALVLLGVFYAATDGVLAALAGQLADTSVRAAAIGTAQTVVAVSRMISAAAFGFLWYGLGRGPAMLLMAAVLAVAVPACFVALRGLDAARVTTSGAA